MFQKKLRNQELDRWHLDWPRNSSYCPWHQQSLVVGMELRKYSSRNGWATTNRKPWYHEKWTFPCLAFGACEKLGVRCTKIDSFESFEPFLPLTSDWSPLSVTPSAGWPPIHGFTGSFTTDGAAWFVKLVIGLSYSSVSSIELSDSSLHSRAFRLRLDCVTFLRFKTKNGLPLFPSER